MTTEHDAMRRNARTIPVLRFCAGCDTSIAPGRRGDKTGAKDADGRHWHLDCYQAEKAKKTPRPAQMPPAVPARISDLYDCED